jgi:hypothetical protein
MEDKSKLEKHREGCQWCVDAGSGNWSYCEEGQRLLSEEPTHPHDPEWCE